MMNSKLNKLLAALSKFEAFDVQDISGSFFDEPQSYEYTCKVERNPFSSLKNDKKLEVVGAGYSLANKSLAFSKALGECIERLCLYFDSDNYSSEGQYIPLEQYLNQSSYTNTAYNWVKGKDLNGKSVLLPAQLIYLNYRFRKKEYNLQQPISTGAVGGFSAKENILKGIYEVVERDSVMCAYLNKLPIQKIISQDRELLEMCQRYKLQWNLFVIFNEFNIPTFLSILIDQTDIGPALVVGSKATFNTSDGVRGSLEEALMSRNFLRRLSLQKLISKNARITRGQYWASKNNINKLDFLLKLKPTAFKISTGKSSIEEQYDSAVSKVLSNNYNIYYVDLTPKELQDLYQVHKVIIPGLQSLFLEDDPSEINFNRIKKFSKRYDIERVNINTVPHPFL